MSQNRVPLRSLRWCACVFGLLLSGTLAMAQGQAEGYDDSDFPDLARLSQPAAATPLDFWRDMAAQFSFDFQTQGLRAELTLPVAGRLNLPFRGDRIAGSGMMALLVKDKGYGPARQLARSRMAAMTSAAPESLKALTREVRRVSESRSRLGEANNRWGNSVDASLATGVTIVADFAGRWLALEAAQQQDVLDEVDISVETLHAMNDLAAGIRRLVRPGALYDAVAVRPQANGLPAPAVFSWLLRQHDADLADRTTAIWRASLLPLVQSSAGPRAAAAVLTPTILWSNERTSYAPFGAVNLRNTGAAGLSNVVVELTMHNGWEERTSYYFLPSWPRNRHVMLMPHPRHFIQREFTVQAKVMIRYWADQQSGELAPVESASPNPRANAAEAHRTAIEFERTHRDHIRYWGALAMLLVGSN